MSYQARWEYLQAIDTRYRQALREGKRRILDELCAPEPVQVYRYMPEVEELKVPVLLFVGERDHQLRRELVIRVAERLKELGRPVELLVYPAAQHAFDFRRANRTLGDDLAWDDALNRTVKFLNRVLGARASEKG